MDSNLNNLSKNLTNITNTHAEGHSIAHATLATLLPSLAKFQGWLTLFLICCAFETCRRVTFHAWGSILTSFWITIDLDEGNRSYDRVMLCLSQHPMLEKAGRFSISDSAPGMEPAASNPGNPENGGETYFLLAINHLYTLWHKGRYIRAYRKKTIHAPSLGASETHYLHISILGGGRQAVTDLLAEATEHWKKVNEERVSVYAPESSGHSPGSWGLICSHPRRLLESVVLDNGVKEDILDDAQEFLSSKKWYSERGIPFRRGYLLFGAPGSGKTSLIKSVAGELKLDVYILSLSQTGLNDNRLRELIRTLPERCIALMEDIDVAFNRNREVTSGMGSPEETERSKILQDGISLSGLLNALDGVGAQEGRMLFATTNDYEALDPALRRPGRIDHLVEFKLASQYQVGELFKRFYLPTPRASTFQPSPYNDPTASKDEDGNRGTSNPGHRTAAEPELEKLIAIESPMGMQDQPFAAIVHQSKRGVEVSSEELDALVERFREAIPEREFSMAALQGYLLIHKYQPQRAVECARKWVEEEMANRGSG